MLRRPLPKEASVNPKSTHAGTPFPVFPASVKTPNAGAPALAAGQILPEEVLPLRLKTVAQLTEVSVKTVRRWIQRGWLCSHKLGGTRVVRKRDLRTFLDQQAGAKNKECQ